MLRMHVMVLPLQACAWVTQLLLHGTLLQLLSLAAAQQAAVDPPGVGAWTVPGGRGPADTDRDPWCAPLPRGHWQPQRRPWLRAAAFESARMLPCTRRLLPLSHAMARGPRARQC